MERTRSKQWEIIVGILLALDRLSMESSKGISNEIGVDYRSIERAIRGFHEPLGLVTVRNVVTSKKREMNIYTISEQYRPIFEEVKERLLAKWHHEE